MKSNAQLTALYNMFNRDVFDNELPHSRTGNFEIGHSGKMTRTYGYCGYTYTKKTGAIESHNIKIATRIMDFSDDTELTKTLLHEMCHLAMHISGNTNAGHGPKWRNKWVDVANKYDKFYSKNVMVKHAVNQVAYRYANCRTVKGVEDTHTVKKYTLTCHTCGWSRDMGRLTKTAKKAILGNACHLHFDGTKCSCKLTAVKNW